MLVAITRDPVFDVLGIAHGNAADDGPRDAGVEQPLQIAFAAHTAAGLT